MKIFGKVGACVLLSGAIVAGSAVAANAHGFIGNELSDVRARAVMNNKDLGAIQWEPQSIEGPKGFSLDPSTGGPADGKLASAGNSLAVNLDEQAPSRWKKNNVKVGSTIAVGWKYTAQHKTSQWHYYITKNGWDQNSSLKRSELQPLKTVTHDGSLAPQNTAHYLTMPADHTGDHVILAVWDVADTSNAFYNTIDVNLSGDVQKDDVPPTAPTQVRATSMSTKSVNLSWNASTDNVGVDRYEIERAPQGNTFTKIGVSTRPSFEDRGITADTTYEYRVIAFDAAGNRSTPSSIHTLTTPKHEEGPDVLAPTAPTGLHSMGTTENSVDLMWNPSEDNIGIHHYEIHRATGNGAFTQVATTPDTRKIDTGLIAGTTYKYRLVAVDAAGNKSDPSTVFTVTTKKHTAPDPTINTWNPTNTYAKGDRVRHNGHLYEAVQNHQGNGDPNWINAPSLWKKIN